MNIQEHIRKVLREENEGHKVKLVIRMIYSLYDEVSFIEQSTYNNKPLLKIYFDSDDTAANIESWFDEKISRDIDEYTSGNIVVCPSWIFNWDVRKKNADVFINTELLKYDNLGNVVNESVLREDRQERILRNYLKEYGLSETSKITGLSITKIIEISNFPIDSKIAHDILMENLENGNLTDTYKGFKIQSNLDGVVYWDGELKTGEFLPNYTEVITVMATPFWDGVDYTPVEIDWFTLEDRSRKIGEQVVVETEGGGNYFKVLKDKKIFDSVEELFSWYDEVYLPGVYDIIINKLLPKVHQDIQDKMDDDMIF